MPWLATMHGNWHRIGTAVGLPTASALTFWCQLKSALFSQWPLKCPHLVPASLAVPGKQIASLETGSAWPSEITFNLADCSKLSFVCDCSDACKHGRVCRENIYFLPSKHHQMLSAIMGVDNYTLANSAVLSFICICTILAGTKYF